MSCCRIDTGDDRRVSKEEFTSDAIKPVIEKWVSGVEDWDAGIIKNAIFKPINNRLDNETWQKQFSLPLAQRLQIVVSASESHDVAKGLIICCEDFGDCNVSTTYINTLS